MFILMKMKDRSISSYQLIWLWVLTPKSQLRLIPCMCYLLSVSRADWLWRTPCYLHSGIQAKKHIRTMPDFGQKERENVVKFHGSLKTHALMWHTAFPSLFFGLRKSMTKPHVSGKESYSFQRMGAANIFNIIRSTHYTGFLLSSSVQILWTGTN